MTKYKEFLILAKGTTKLTNIITKWKIIIIENVKFKEPKQDLLHFHVQEYPVDLEIASLFSHKWEAAHQQEPKNANNKCQTKPTQR